MISDVCIALAGLRLTEQAQISIDLLYHLHTVGPVMMGCGISIVVNGGVIFGWSGKRKVWFDTSSPVTSSTQLAIDPAQPARES